MIDFFRLYDWSWPMDNAHHRLSLGRSPNANVNESKALQRYVPIYEKPRTNNFVFIWYVRFQMVTRIVHVAALIIGPWHSDSFIAYHSVIGYVNLLNR